MQHADDRSEGGSTRDVDGSMTRRTPTWDDDPSLEQLRAWRNELDFSVPAQTSALESSVSNRGSQPTGAVSNKRARPDGKPREGRRPPVAAARPRYAETSPWIIPGFGRHSTAQDPVDEPARSAVPRPLPDGHSGWDVTAIAAPTPVSQRSAEEIAQAQAMTVAFPALDFVPVGENAEPDIAIEAKSLRKSFKDMVAVSDVSFSVPRGRILALLGPNGAGKTTTVNMLCTLLRPDGGTASVFGHDVVADAAAVRRSIMLTGQFAALDEGLTGRENLVMFGRLLGLKKKAAKARAAELLTMFGLESAATRKVGQYSGGMRRRIDIACGLVTEPRVVFLDEPTTGLDPRSRQDVWALVEQLRAQGVTILLTTQYLEEADLLADRIVVIDRGRVIAEGTSDELKAATGAAYCEVTPVHPAYLPRLRWALRDLLGSTDDQLDAVDGTLSVPAPEGPATLSEVLRRAEAGEIPLSDIALRRPSLDEVFLSLTDPASNPAEVDEVQVEAKS